MTMEATTMNTKATDKTTEFTVPQQKVLDFIKKGNGSAEATVLQARGYDIRAANNLVRKNVLTLTNGVYRIKPAKVPSVSADPEPAKPSTEERTAEVVEDAVSEPAKEDKAPESAERPAG